MSSNGRLTSADLASAAGGVPGSDPGQGKLAKDTSRRWNAMAAEILKKEGVRIGCNGPDSMYRPVARQEYWRNYWCARGNCGNAATPGNSNHGLGLAIDNNFRSLIAKYGGPYGFRWECSDAPWESWHLKDCGGGSYDGPDPGPDYADGPQYPTLKRGDDGGAVKRMQDRLRVHNLGITRPEVDGDLGKATEQAVREFQTVHGLKVDGVVGEQTWKKLRRRNVHTDRESSHVNRLRLLERQKKHTDDDREKIHAHREWLARRRDWMRAQPDAWWTNKRNARFVIVKREAGDA